MSQTRHKCPVLRVVTVRGPDDDLPTVTQHLRVLTPDGEPLRGVCGITIAPLRPIHAPVHPMPHDGMIHATIETYVELDLEAVVERVDMYPEERRELHRLRRRVAELEADRA